MGAISLKRAFLNEICAGREIVNPTDRFNRFWIRNNPWRLNKCNSISFSTSQKDGELETRIERIRSCPNVNNSGTARMADDEATHSLHCRMYLIANPTPKGENKRLDFNSPLAQTAR